MEIVFVSRLHAQLALCFQIKEICRIPVIGNGDVATGADVEVRRAQTRVRGIMIGRAAMTNPWVFQEARHYLSHGVQPDPVPAETRLAFMRRHCVLAIAHSTRGGEFEVIRAMRSRLMHYTRSLPSGKFLRNQFASVGSLMQLDDISAAYLEHRSRVEDDSLPLPS